MRPATSRGSQVPASLGRGSISSESGYSDLALRCPKIGWAEYFQHGSRLFLPRRSASSSLSRDKTRGFVSRHLLWVPNRNCFGTSGGRWAGQRAVPEPCAAAPPPRRASLAQPGDAAEARRIPAGQRRPLQRRGPGRRVRRLPAPSHSPPPYEAFSGDPAPGLPLRCPSSPGLLTPPPRSQAHGRGQPLGPRHGGVPVPGRLPVRGRAGVPPGL